MKLLHTLVMVLFFCFTADSMARTWMNTKGKQIEADFVKLDQEVVHLKKGGKFYKVALEKLSAKDQQFVEDEVKQLQEDADKKTSEPVKPDVKLPFNLKQKVSGDDLNVEQISGKPVVLHQWNAHCGACPPSLENFEKVAKRKKTSGATFLIWHSADKIELAKSKSESLKLKLPVYHGKMIKWDEKKFGKFTWPHVVIVNVAGEVVYMGAEDKNFDKAFKLVTETE